MRRQDFLDTVSHRAPQKMTVDFGGCPLSTADGAVIAKMKDFLGFYGNDEDERLHIHLLLCGQRLFTLRAACRSTQRQPYHQQRGGNLL